MKYLLAFIILITSCRHGDISSLCIMDPEEGMCWTNKEEGKGFRIEDMEDWYSINEDEFRLILRRLEECQNSDSN